MTYRIILVFTLLQIHLCVARNSRSYSSRKDSLLTKCQQLRQETRKIPGSFIPKCNKKGFFERQQCIDKVRYNDETFVLCWNVSEHGKKKSGYYLKYSKPKKASNFDAKSLLTKCEKMHLRRLIKLREASVIPQCTRDGHFKKVQCTKGKTKCWCVDAKGKKIPHTKVHNNEPKCFHDVCGKRFKLSTAGSRKRRVVGGNEASANTWPWQALIIYNNKNNKHICGGTMVKENWLVTSASCFDGLDRRLSKWSVRLGAHKRLTTSYHDRISVERIYLHPKYDQGNRTHPGDYDVAVVQVANSANIPDTVWTLCLPNNTHFYRKGKRCSITGWGHTSYGGKLANNLREGWVDLVPLRECNKKRSYNGRINARFMCAGYEEGGVDACHYDTGGPLACPVAGGIWTLAGIVSWRQKCAEPRKYGVYTNVHVIKPWLEKTIGS